jgi:hypothetical protein
VALLTRWIRSHLLTTAAGVIMTSAGGPAFAQSAIWDAALSNSHWYVPVPQLLAYAAPATGFSNPIAIGDQTLWSLGAATNGAFTGFSSAQLAIGPASQTENSTIQGFVATSGQITMVFTPVGGGTPTVGLGQMRLINGVWQMEMQMITGQNLLITHWAYMTPYNPATFSPPAPQPILANSVPEWAWTSGTRWRIASPSMFGTATPGRFVVSDYQNGYFWGSGAAPSASSAGNFTLLGSLTPEGRVLFNTLSRGNLTSLYGSASGDASGAQMLVSTYDLAGNPTGGLATVSLVQPYAEVLAGQDNRAGPRCCCCARPDGVNAAWIDRRHGADICDPRQSRCAGAFERRQPDLARPHRRSVAGDLRHAARAAADRYRPPRRRLRPAYRRRRGRAKRLAQAAWRVCKPGRQ